MSSQVQGGDSPSALTKTLCLLALSMDNNTVCATMSMPFFNTKLSKQVSNIATSNSNLCLIDRGANTTGWCVSLR